MGIQVSKPLERKLSKTKSNLSQKIISNDEIVEFASQLNNIACLASVNSEKLDYVVFQKIPFTGKFSLLPFCSKVSEANNPIFLCYDCSVDSHAYLCESCFQKGNHEGHRFSVFPNNKGLRQSFCRCGDFQFVKKNVICQAHKQVKKLPTVSIDQKQKKTFSLYFDEIFKTLFSLLQKNRGQVMLDTLFNFLNKSTENNLYYSKLLCQFLLQKNSVDGQSSNLRKLLKLTTVNNMTFLRNLNFAPEYKLDILRQFIISLNQNTQNVYRLTQLIINFSGKMDHLQKLAKDQNIFLGMNCQLETQNDKLDYFYTTLIAQQYCPAQMWKSIVSSKLIKFFTKKNEQVITAIIRFLNTQKQKQKNKEISLSLLEQLLQCPIEDSQKYIIPCLMTISPAVLMFSKHSKVGEFDKRIEGFFAGYYSKIFAHYSTHEQSQNSFQSLFLILPFFSFGEAAINKFWDQLDRRVNILQKIKQKSIIKQASMNFFNFLTSLLTNFLSWEHFIVKQANEFCFKEYMQDKKLIQRLLRQNFQKRRKLYKPDLLEIIDSYIKNQRSLAAESTNKFLRYHTRKGKYYYVGQRLRNNLFNYEQLDVGVTFKLGEWQESVGKKVFSEKLYKIVPKILKIAQKGLMEDIEMVKTVSNISIALSLLNKSERKSLKQVTRNFIKQIPDVKEDVYYVLATIRDRFQLDLDDMEESGMKGSKKVKLDLISQIRDKNYRDMKDKQDRVLSHWLKRLDKRQMDESQEQIQENLCHICKQKGTQKSRLVYPCNFSRNNVVSTLLKSQVTDLDINICLHKIHQDCFEKINSKNQCPVCKFGINCYLPLKPLADESYTKGWLKKFERIVTTINLESGKSFNSDWATIFMTYLVFSRSFKVLLKNNQLQTKQRLQIDYLIMLHYNNQLDKWPELTKQALKKAEKTVKGQVRRQSNIKKAVKSLSLDLVIQEITQQPFKNEARIQKKIRQLVNFIGLKNSEKVTNCFEHCRDNQSIKQILQQSISEENQGLEQMFKIRMLPETPKQFLQTTSIKCPMCGKYEQTTWQCLFCSKISCEKCQNIRFHCQRQHRGTSIILYLNNADYLLMYDNTQIQRDSLYRNEFLQGWKRNMKPEGWKRSNQEMYSFFDKILHSLNPRKIQCYEGDDNSDFGGFINQQDNNNNNRRHNHFGMIPNSNNNRGLYYPGLKTMMNDTHANNMMFDGEAIEEDEE